MDEDEVRASGLLGSLKKIGKKVEEGVVNAGNTVAKPTKKVISKIPKPVRDVLQQEAQGLVDTTGATLGTLISTATGDEELGNMVKQGISDTGNELLSGQRLSLGSKILPIAKRSVNVVVDQMEDPRYRAVAKQIMKKIWSRTLWQSRFRTYRKGIVRVRIIGCRIIRTRFKWFRVEERQL